MRWKRFFKWAKKSQEPTQATMQHSKEQGPSLSQSVTFGAHRYRSPGEVAEVIFTNRARNIQRVLVDNDGNIQNFPGYEAPEQLMRILENGTLPPPLIRYRTDFKREPDGRFLMIWEVQPDGRYWEDDDGFGGGADEEVRLYTYIDIEGHFTGPFQVYNIGDEIWYRITAK